MAELSHGMVLLIADAGAAFRQMGVADWTRSRGEGKWTRLEILGHLIDSAGNNHQRFARALAQEQLEFPGYDQAALVKVQRYGASQPPVIINLWESFNFYLARLIATVPYEKRGTPCRIGSGEAVTLEFLILDYVAHLQHHLRQIFDGMTVSIRWVPPQGD